MGSPEYNKANFEGAIDDMQHALIMDGYEDVDREDVRDAVIDALEDLKARIDREKRQHEPLSEEEKGILALAAYDVTPDEELEERSRELKERRRLVRQATKKVVSDMIG